MALPDNPPPDDLTLKSKKDEEPIYMHLPSFKFCTLMHDGEVDGHSGGRTGRVEWHDTLAEARAYLRGVSDAQEACDYTLAAVTKKDFVYGEPDEETDEELLAQVDADDCEHKDKRPYEEGGMLFYQCNDCDAILPRGPDDEKTRAKAALDEEDEGDEEGVPDKDEEHPNHCISCEQWFSDKVFVRMYDKCEGCSLSTD